MASALDSMMEALRGGLASAMPSRQVTRDFKPLPLRNDADLKKGVLTLVHRGEGNYAGYVGRDAQLGTSNVLLIGQLMVASNAGGLAVEKAELTMAEEIKAFLNGPMPAGIRECLTKSFDQSGQLEAPRGWVVFDLEVMGDE